VPTRKEFLFLGIVELAIAMYWPGCVSAGEHYVPVFSTKGEEVKWGYADRDGTVIIDPQFDYCRPFREDRAAIQISKKWGFVDRSGSIVIEPKYYYAQDFSEGCAAVKIRGENELKGKPGGWGFIDTEGKKIVDGVYLFVGRFSEGLAYVETDANGGYIDKHGKMVINGPYQGGDFHNGTAVVNTVIRSKQNDGSVGKAGGSRGLLDKQGHFVPTNHVVSTSTTERVLTNGAPDSFVQRPWPDRIDIPIPLGTPEHPLIENIAEFLNSEYGMIKKKHLTIPMQMTTPFVYNVNGKLREDYCVQVSMGILKGEVTATVTARYRYNDWDMIAGFDKVVSSSVSNGIIHIIRMLPQR
jgi:hypothetical protein